MKMNKTLARMLLAVLALLLLLPIPALAAESIDLNRDCELTISAQDGETPLVGVSYSLYRVADVDRTGALKATGDFSEFHVDLEHQSGDIWKTLASTLEGYVLRDQLKPLDSGRTNKQGQLRFPTGSEKLQPGLYLVLGSRHVQNGKVYDAQPFMVMLPALDRTANAWSYSVTVNGKFESHDPSGPGPEPEPETITRKVLKVWQDGGNQAARPKEVVVQLLRDGQVYDTVALRAENNWSYTWEELSNDYRWNVVEKTEGDYTVQVVREGITFVVTNTFTPTPPPEKDPDPDPEPKPEPDPEPTPEPTPDPTPDFNIPDDSTPEGDLNLPDGLPDGEIPGDPVPLATVLPQTGQLWWPVPLLGCAGLLFVVLGLLRRRGYSDER